MHGVVLLVAVARSIGLHRHHIHTGNGRAGRAVGDTSAHGTCGARKADVRDLVLYHRTVRTFVLHCDAIVVIHTGQRCLIGEQQVLIRTRHPMDSRPRIACTLRQAAVNDIGLGGIGLLLLVDLPGELDHAGIDTFLGIEIHEQRALTDTFLGSGYLAELDIVYPAFHAVGARLTTVDRLRRIGHTRSCVHTVLTIQMLLRGAVLPYVIGLVIAGNNGIDRLGLVVDKDLERVPEALRIAVRCPCQFDVVEERLRPEVVHRHRTAATDCFRHSRLLFLRVDIPRVGYVIERIGLFLLVAEASVGVRPLTGVERSYLRVAAVEHPLKIRIVARRTAERPGQIYRLGRLIERGIERSGLDHRRLDSCLKAAHGAVVGIRAAVQHVLHRVGAHLCGTGQTARKRAFLTDTVLHRAVVAARGARHKELRRAIVHDVFRRLRMVVHRQRLRGKMLLDIDEVTTCTFVHICRTT